MVGATGRISGPIMTALLEGGNTCQDRGQMGRTGWDGLTDQTGWDGRTDGPDGMGSDVIDGRKADGQTDSDKVLSDDNKQMADKGQNIMEFLMRTADDSNTLAHNDKDN